MDEMKNQVLETAILKNINFFMDACERDFGTAAYIGPFIVNNLSDSILKDNFFIYSPANKQHTWEKFTFFRMLMITKYCLKMMKIDRNDPQWRSKRTRAKYCINQLKMQIKEYIGADNWENMEQVAPYKRKLEFLMAMSLLDILNTFTDLPVNTDLENVMQGYSPIVPYQGTIKKPEMKDEDKPTIESFFELELSGKYDDPYMNASAIKDQIESAIVVQFKYGFNVILSDDKTVNDLGIITEEKFLDMLKKIDSEMHSADLYAILSYYDRMALPDTRLRQKASDIVSGKYYAQSLEALINDVDKEYDPQVDLDKLNTSVDIHSDMAPNTGSYPLDTINNYIDEHRELQPSENISNMILSGLSNIGKIEYNYAQHSGIPMAEFDDRLLVCPVVDASKSYKPTLVYMDRSGNINQTEYTVNMKI